MTAARQRPMWQVGLALSFGLALVLIFTALGVWQVERLGWKRDLIARVEARVNAAPVPLAAIRDMAPADQEYRRVSVAGVFDHDAETLVQALTELGGGYWVLTPLRMADGRTVLINRGFVPQNRRRPDTRAEGQVKGTVAVTGLARLSEPGGTFLRANAPAADRWYSRDLAAIAAKRGLGPVEPVFIDTDATPQPGGFPVGGLTVLRFRNAHLSYALTWFALAALAAGGVWLLIQTARRTARSADAKSGLRADGRGRGRDG
ncbi:SURF1 family protein [Paracoccus pacificus]|uniref:SURF1-like protein n=1 Tax=Paracoccus pacificus TaxID=1463598 RepID=A0ABW4R4N7_9RHOB